jgi:hypothetical protein
MTPPPAWTLGAAPISLVLYAVIQEQLRLSSYRAGLIHACTCQRGPVRTGPAGPAAQLQPAAASECPLHRKPGSPACLRLPAVCRRHWLRCCTVLHGVEVDAVLHALVVHSCWHADLSCVVPAERHLLCRHLTPAAFLQCQCQLTVQRLNFSPHQGCCTHPACASAFGRSSVPLTHCLIVCLATQALGSALQHACAGHAF